MISLIVLEDEEFESSIKSQKSRKTIIITNISFYIPVTETMKKHRSLHNMDYLFYMFVFWPSFPSTQKTRWHFSLEKKSKQLLFVLNDKQWMSNDLCFQLNQKLRK